MSRRRLSRLDVALAALTVALCGCGEEPYELVIGEGFSDWDRLNIEEAAEQWLSVGCVLGRIEVRRGSPRGKGGHYRDGIISIHPNLTNTNQAAVTILHEFGHACGAKLHHSGPGVMTTGYTGHGFCLSRLDVALIGKEGSTCPD